MKHILVTGCQRSSTRFYAHYLSKLLNINYVDEKEYNIENYGLLLRRLNKPSVIHGPSLKHKVRKFKRDFPEGLVIWMYRDLKECKLSMERIGWDYEESELKKVESCLMEVGTKVRLVGEFKELLINLTLNLGILYFKLGFVDQIINSRSLEHLKGFKKNQGVIGLK